MVTGKRLISLLCMVMILGFWGNGILAQETYDVTITYIDGREEVVHDLWEYYQREPVRELCYLDAVGKPHVPHVNYDDIITIDISDYKNNARLNKILITRKDGTTLKGLLWGNDRFFATDKNGDEWRGIVFNLKQIRFLSPESAVEDTTQSSGDSDE